MTKEEACNFLEICAFYLKDGTKYMKPEHEQQFRQAYEMAIEALRERQNGAWKKDGYYLECSCCGYRIEADDLEMNNYCSACGAKMT